MKAIRTITTSVVLATMALAPAAALAKHGADDPPGDDRGGQSVVDDNGGRSGAGGSDDSSSGDDRGGRRDSGRSSGAATSRVRRSANARCTGNSTAKLKSKSDDGRLETEFEVDQNRNGVRWRVSLRRNGAVVVRTSATTRAPSGSFSVERRLANRAGSDTISARAVSSSGEVCTASVTI